MQAKVVMLLGAALAFQNDAIAQRLDFSSWAGQEKCTSGFVFKRCARSVQALIGTADTRAVDYVLKFPLVEAAPQAESVCRSENNEFRRWFEPLLLQQLNALPPASKPDPYPRFWR